jgi:DNA polymerase bacteriophage-type
VPNNFSDLETFSRNSLKDGTHKYAEAAEIMIWSWAIDDGQIYIWDLVNKYLHWLDEFTGLWEEQPTSGAIPHELVMSLMNEETLVWFQNGGMFDFVILEKCKPGIAKMIEPARRRDTMVQAFAHSLPGALEKMGDALDLHVDHRKDREGKRLIHLFCKPQSEDFVKKYGTDRATKQTHPADWMRFIQYAGGDIATMRAAHKKMPMWNYKGREIDLWNLDLKINARGFHIDQDHARAAITVSDRRKAELAKRTQEITDGAVTTTNQRDVLLKFILEMHGVTLPDLLADTLERRMADPDLPDAVKELIQIRLQASMNSVSKYKTVLRAVCEDGRIRGGAQFRGAARTGRWAHRLFQHGNMPRPTLDHKFIELCIEMMKRDELELVYADVMEVCRSSVRGTITAAPGKKLVVADLANIEGRGAAWTAGEEWKLQAFIAYDNGEGPDLYIVAYASSFNVDPSTIDKSTMEGYAQRQIGKVEELMFQYGGGVGAWITGAATYGIDLNAMTEAVWDTLPEWAKSESTEYLKYLYEAPAKRYQHRIDKKGWSVEEAGIKLDEEQKKKRLGLEPKVFIACDAIKRLWRRAHPMIASYWKELEDTFRQAFWNKGETFTCRKVKMRSDGGWVRIALPSGRCLCYPSVAIGKRVKDPDPAVDEELLRGDEISYAGFNQYTRQWGRVGTYGGKIFENIVQAIACDQLAYPMFEIEERGYPIIFHVHDEIVCETPDEPEYIADELSNMMCMELGWNAGLPLAAAGWEGGRYHKEG